MKQTGLQRCRLDTHKWATPFPWYGKMRWHHQLCSQVLSWHLKSEVSTGSVVARSRQLWLTYPRRTNLLPISWRSFHKFRQGILLWNIAHSVTSCRLQRASASIYVLSGISVPFGFKSLDIGTIAAIPESVPGIGKLRLRKSPEEMDTHTLYMNIYCLQAQGEGATLRMFRKMSVRFIYKAQCDLTCGERRWMRSTLLFRDLCLLHSTQCSKYIKKILILYTYIERERL